MMGSEKDAIIEELFESLLQGFNKDLKNQWKEVNLFLIKLIYCIIILVSLNRSKSYIDSSWMVKNKKATINKKTMTMRNVFNML